MIMSTDTKTSVLSGWRWLLCAAALAVVGGTGMVIGQTLSSTVPNLPLVNLTPDPLYQRGVAAKPTLTLALSVEYPTVGAAYVSPTNSRMDETFKTENEYLGYFDYLGCYKYQQDTNYFVRTGSADQTTHRCSDTAAFSGNFLNWASASAIDILRMGLTGGDRVTDTAGQTVLQRAVLPDGTNTQAGTPSFYNSDDFPAKHIDVSVTNVTGLVPSGFNGGGDIYVANCQNLMFMGSAATGSCAAPGNNAAYRSGGFQVRVAVCDAADVASRETYMPGYCHQYPSGNYKPIGNLQKYADRVRVAVFGYLLDHDPTTYGGVLRAPMAYLGKNDYDENYQPKSGTNPYAEWDETTGVFLDNPRLAQPTSGTTKTVSGAVNYINQFGRSGGYKGFDPVSELYYESLRYLRGMNPTTKATDHLSIPAMDGFPVYSTVSSSSTPTAWSDPHPSGSKITDYSCVNNNILTIGDVNTHNDGLIPTDEPVQFGDWLNVVAGFETGSSVQYLDGKNNQQSTADSRYPNPTPNADLSIITGTGPWPWIETDGNTYNIAGMAYWAHTHDIRPSTTGDKARPGMRVTTYTIDVNEYGAQTAYANHSHNQYFLAAKYGGFTDYSGVDQGNPFVVASSDAEAVKTNQSLRNNSWKRPDSPDSQPEARNYFLGNEAKQMLAALDNIFADITKDAGSVAGFAVDARRVDDTKAVYQGRFDPDNWHGDLVSYPLSAVTSGVALNPTGTVNWRAAQKLDSRDWTSRNIVVGIQNNGSTSAINFTADEVAGSSLISTFQKSPDPTVTTLDSVDVAKTRVEFLRGKRFDEQPKGPLRARASAMGDIINSGVVYMGAPTTSIADLSYQSFYTINKDRTRTVFAGANDGMLHAFNASNGEELFAYIPSWVVPKLNQLTWPNYHHESYVDATPTVAEANLGSTGSPDWRTVLVGGTGGGGQGVYALDVTDPTKFGTGKVLWEFTDADDADPNSNEAFELGNVVGRVRILKLHVGGDYKWFAVFGSGVNNYANDGHANTSGNPAIFMLDLSKPASSPWRLNKNYFKIVLPKIDSLQQATGVLNVAAATDNDRAVTTLYAGDLHGQLWKVNVGLGADLTNLQPQLLFVTQQNAGVAQPITSAPALFRVEGHIIAVLGTGKFLEANDKALVNGSFPAQSVYAVYDSGASSQRKLTYQDLMKISVTSGTWAGSNFAWGIPSDDPAAPKQYAGWYFDFPGGDSTGEREIGLMVALPGTVVFNTIIPGGDSCSTGSGVSYTLSLFSGGGTRVVLKDMLADPILLEGDPTVTAYESRSADSKKPIKRIDCTTDGCTSSDVTMNRLIHRISWRELANYEEIKNRK